ncbi:copper resistance D family protein [Methylocystis rosea]|uniref:copper resistance D family protein n=1 Tax=Methylocystis rosea TaxID=173366 RepID=UPI00037F3C61|nr:CopD family protein [Methylocystis rosea]
MQAFIALYGFLDLVLRAYLLATQAIIVGGIAFLTLVLSPVDGKLDAEEAPIARRCLRIIFWSCCASVFGEIVAVGVLTAMLVGTLQVDFAVAASADAVVSHFIAMILSGALALYARLGASAFFKWRGGAVALALLLACAHVGVTHAASRPVASALLVTTEIVHVLAAAIWIGGIPFLLVALGMTKQGAARRLIVSKFSRNAMWSVGALIAAGLLMTTRHFSDFSALYETNYGMLLSTKIVLLFGLLCFAAANLSTTRKLWRISSTPIRRLLRFSEVEVGLGLVTLFCAAALASASLPTDGAERTSLSEITARFAPRWPSFYSPAYAELSAAQTPADVSSVAEPATPSPPSAADIAWAEMNHHLAGVFVVLMGFFALLERHRQTASAARHWPLLFLLLGGILVVRADETAWPLGPIGFFESLRDPQIVQHKVIVVLIATFAIFEWQVRRGRFKSDWPAFVFPITTGAAAAFLLTHYGHTEGKDEVLVAISHTPIALLGVVSASARWLEIRLSDTSAGRIAGYVWPMAFLLSGLLLLLYREA